MSEKQSVQDDGSFGQYAIIIPLMADDDLNAAQMRLYVHYKRLYAEKGKCEESVRETEKVTGMSKYLVQKTRDELAELSYIAVEKPTKEQARKGQTVHVTLIDRWAENVSRYAKGVSILIQQPNEGVSKLIQGVSKSVQVNSDANDEAVSKLIRKESIQEKKSIASQKSDAVAASEVTSRIAAWLNALTAVPIGNHYQNKTNRAHAVEMFNRGITPEQIGSFVKHLLSQPFWKGKTIKFHYVAENIPAWLETQKPAGDNGEKLPSQYTSPLDGLRFVS